MSESSEGVVVAAPVIIAGAVVAGAVSGCIMTARAIKEAYENARRREEEAAGREVAALEAEHQAVEKELSRLRIQAVDRAAGHRAAIEAWLESEEKVAKRQEQAARVAAAVQQQQLALLGRQTPTSGTTSSQGVGGGITWGRRTPVATVTVPPTPEEGPSAAVRRQAQEMQVLLDALERPVQGEGGERDPSATDILLDAQELFLDLQGARAWAPEALLTDWLTRLEKIRSGRDTTKERRKALEGVRKGWDALRNKTTEESIHEIAQQKQQAVAARRAFHEVVVLLDPGRSPVSELLAGEQSAYEEQFLRGNYSDYRTRLDALTQQLLADGVAEGKETADRLLKDAATAFGELGYESVEVGEGLVTAFSTPDDHDGRRAVSFEVDDDLSFHLDIGPEHDSQKACSRDAKRFYDLLGEKGWALQFGKTEKTYPVVDGDRAASVTPDIGTLLSVAQDLFKSRGLSVERYQTREGGTLVVYGTGWQTVLSQSDEGLHTTDGRELESEDDLEEFLRQQEEAMDEDEGPIAEG